MKTIGDYRSEILVLLGDTAGKRYSEAQLDSALRSALDRLNRFLPAREKVKLMVTESGEGVMFVNRCPDADREILAVRSVSGELLNAAAAQEGGRTRIMVYGRNALKAGEYLLLEVSAPHRISGLDGAVQTSVPESLFLTVCTGAAGYAMRIRARSVTEVFGKRPEDTEKLLVQAGFLLADFEADLELRSLKRLTRSDPWPGRGFPI